ncbi:MAG: AAA family ATPase, partial [Candidatus Binataceae bacterium]
MKFCGDCGAALPNLCPQCGADNPAGKRFCGECGTALETFAATASAKKSNDSPIRVAEKPAPENLDGERKTVTALFADLKGSTQLMEGLDPEAAHAIVAPALRIMAEAVHRYEGYVARTTGDGIFALFGAPTAYEDHPQRALYAALQMQQELRAEGQRHSAKGLHALEARVGVHTGEVVAYTVETGGKVEYRLIGHTANLAARLESIAPVGSIATSEYTRQLCEGYFELRGLGPTTLKGLSTPIEVYEVTGLGALRTHFQVALQRGLTKFVGRDHELAQLRRALELAIDGRGQIVAVMADAGTGKSRLFHEFKVAIPPTCKVLEAYSVSHGKASPWLPVLELLRGYFGIQDADDAAARRAKVRDGVTALDPALEDGLPYLFGLLGIVEGPDPIAQMDPQIKRQRTLDAIKRIILRASLKQPVVVIFEDLHWIDAQTQALLDVLANSIASSRVLLLCNYRPEYRHEWTNKSYYAQLRLDPLGGAEGWAMLAALLGEGVELNPLKRLITERTGGNPFFIEEIVQALFDEGALTRNGVVKVTRSLSQLRLPPTVQGMLAARVDRLVAQQKELLQTLAVIGRESSLALLSQVASHADTRLERTLADLQAAEFIYEQLAATGVEYVFKHALTQEVAYNSLLIERRKQLHERAGQALESLFAGQLDDHLSQLAHHYSHSDNADKAIEYLGRAGQQAMLRSANNDAVANLSSAIDLLPLLPDGFQRARRELFLQLTLGQALIPIMGFAAQEIEQIFARARELCEGMGEPPELFDVLQGLHGVHFIRGDYRTSYELDEQVLQLATRASDRGLMMRAHYLTGLTSFYLGEFLSAQEHLALATSLYDRERDRSLAFRGADALANGMAYQAMVLWQLGYPDQALSKTYDALAWARKLSNPYNLASAEFFVGVLHGYRREAQEVRAIEEHVVAFSVEHGFALWQAFAPLYHSWAIAQQGRGEEGITQMQVAMVKTRAIGVGIGLPNYLILLAEMYLDVGQAEKASIAVTEAMALAAEQSDRSREAEIHRIRGEVLLAQEASNGAEAERCFERAIEVARKQSAKSF